MTEKELIAKIRELRQIKPREEWVLFTKKELFREERSLAPLKGAKLLSGLSQIFQIPFQHKPAFATAVVLLVLIGVFGFAQNSVPGDMLFSIKKITEKSQTVFISEKEEPKHNLELANKRLDELTRIAETNQTQKLAPAVNEYQETISQAAESLEKARPKEIAEEVKKIEEKTEKIKSLGIEIGENDELANALAKLLEREIGEIEERSLTEDQEASLAQIKEEYEGGNYSQALELLIMAF